MAATLTKLTSICQYNLEPKKSTTTRATNWCDQWGTIFLWWCHEWSLGVFKFYCATFSWPVNFNFGHFLKGELYNHYWIFILGAREPEYFNSTPDFSKWPRTNLTWATVDETWLDCGSLIFHFHDSGTPIDPTLSSRCDAIGENYNWTELWFLIFDEQLTYLSCSSHNAILTTVYFTSLRLGTRFPTKLRIFLLWVTSYEIVLVKWTSWNHKNSIIYVSSYLNISGWDKTW